MQTATCTKHPDRLIMPSRLRRFPGATTGCVECSKESRARGRKKRAAKFASAESVKCKNHPTKRANRGYYLATGGRLCAGCLSRKADGSLKTRRKPDWVLTIKPAATSEPFIIESDLGIAFYDELTRCLWRVTAQTKAAVYEGVQAAIRARLVDMLSRDPACRELKIVAPDGNEMSLPDFLRGQVASECLKTGFFPAEFPPNEAK